MSDTTPIAPTPSDHAGTAVTSKQDDPLAAPAFEYSLFLSYSTEPDYDLARTLESGLETFHQLPTPNDLVLPPLAVCVDGSDFHSARAKNVEEAIRNSI